MTQRRSALVTGASSGIGRATAVLLAEAGYDLALVARREGPLRKAAELAAERARQTGHQTDVAVLPGDVTRAEECHRLAAAARERFGRIDALVNVAGAAPRLGIEQVTDDIWRRCIDTNLSAVVHLTAACWRVFREQRGGVIVNVSSLASIDPFSGFAIYAAAKAAVNMFTRCAAKEGAPCGIRSVAVAPGAVETPMLREIFDESIIPRHMTLLPTDVAEVIRDCVTGARGFESGQTIVMPSP